jgi:hypothetical protein
MTRSGWEEFEDLAKSFFEKECGVRLLRHMPVTLSSREAHKFDLVSESENIVVECKNHTWTKSGNYPSAKIESSQRAISLPHDSGAQRKIIAFYDDFFGGKSLVEVFVRRNRKLLTGIEVWRYLEDHFEIFANLSETGKRNSAREVVVVPDSSNKDSRLVERAVTDLKDTVSQSATTVAVPIPSLASHLKVPAQDVARLGPQICQVLRQEGVQANVDERKFSIRKDLI